ncbi:MAG: hypothetical protein OXO49_08135 [Gammaproteobacteria bacterium]|nr:hypothetical protein [Gammaproteobacteria bacterium]MDE0251559.1 hypothetical protein [Gammaproteobacteria bacterium]MDE0403431.1 hypothetical protein [Gammaproteobacteria bacterium]
MTKEYAVKNGIWPRSTDIDPERKDETNDEGESEDEVEDDSHKPVELIEEGLLGDVLVKIWEQADFKKMSTIHKLRIKVYESNELVFRLLSVIGTISDATKDIKLEANYSTENGGELLLEYQGPVDEFEFVREFLAPQMRSGNLSLNAETTIEFTPPVSVSGSKKQDLHSKLTQFQLGTVEVHLTAIGSIESPKIVE